MEEKMKECILEAIRITMTRNNCSFLGKYYTQVDGATIGGPCSGSVTDIYGAEYIDRRIYQECPYSIEEYRRYRDDTIEINTESSLEEQANITKWLNENIKKGKIKFTDTSSNTEIEFLDVKITLENGYLHTQQYSKKTDIHQYLNPASSHPPPIFKGIVKSVGIRLRRICSKREGNDS